MGSSCTSQVFPQENQLTAQQEKSAKSSKVEPRKNEIRKTKRSLGSVHPLPDNERSRAPHGDAGSSRATVEVAPVVKTADIINTESNKENRISETEIVCIAEKSCGTADDINDFYENDVENDFNTEYTDDDTTEDDLDTEYMDDDTNKDDLDTEYMDDDTNKDDLDTDDLDEVDSKNDTDSDSILSSVYDGSSDSDDMEDSNSKTSDSRETEQCVGGMSDKNQKKTTPEKKTNLSPVKCTLRKPFIKDKEVQSRKCRCISSIMRRLGLRHSKSSTMSPETATVAENACNTCDDMVPDTVAVDENSVSELTPETIVNCKDCGLYKDDKGTSSEEGTKQTLIVVQSRKRRYIIAALRKLGIRCSVNLAHTRRPEPLPMKTEERTCVTNNDSTEEDQKKTPPEEEKTSPVAVQSRKWRLFRHFMRRLGFEGVNPQSNTEQPNIVVLYSAQNACTTDDSDNKCSDSKDNEASVSANNAECTGDPVELGEAPTGTPRSAWEDKK